MPRPVPQPASLTPSCARVLALGLLLAAPAAVGAQAPPGGPTPEPHVVAGTVRTADGRPLAGATIRVAGSTGAGRGTTVKTTTDARGRYRVAVPPGHYDVDGFADIAYDGETYRELWLERVGAGCGRVLSDRGIVRHFVLRLSGLKRCINNPDPNEPGSYHGAYLTALSSALPAASVVTFTFQPLGPLADGTAGRPLTFTRTGAALARGGGTIGETSFLHDIPLGRYRVTAAVRGADGRRAPLRLAVTDGGDQEGEAIEVAFPAYRMYPYGIRSLTLGLRLATGAEVARGPASPAAPEPARGAGPADEGAPGLPAGAYACSYRSPYAGDLPTGKSIAIVDGRRYRAYGDSGTYAVDAGAGRVRWLSGPLAASGVRVSVGERNGRPAITVVGGGAADDTDQTNYCVLSPG